VPTPEPVNSDTLKIETALAVAKAWIEQSYLMLKLDQKDTTILTRLDNAIKEKYYWQTLYEKLRITPEPVKYVPKIYKQALSICIFIFICAFLFIGWKAYKFFKPKI
jgi:hypothetical protein